MIMKIYLLIAGLFLSVCAWPQVENAVPDPPSPPALYNDFTQGKKFITREQASFLESKLVAYDDSTSSQIAIVIVEDLKNYTANEFATALGRKWGVGGREFSNGIVILISTGGGEGNRDAYIATGYGLEGAIPDITAKRIVENELIANFREGNFFRGLDETVDAIILAARGEYKGSGKGRGGRPGFIIPVIIIIIVWIILAIISRGGRGGGFASRRGYRGWMGPTIWGTGGGGWSGGSSGGGFGGFGGFGGGSFGGGGAGGKW